MGSCLGSCAGSCLGSCALTACCKLTGCSCIASPTCANLMYVAIITAATIASLSLRYTNTDLNIGYDIGTQPPSVCVPDAQGNGCDSIAYDLCNSVSCQGYWAVYRVSFALAGFFFLMMVLTCGTSQFSSTLHRGYWFGKVLVILAILAGALFAPNDMFAAYAWVARIGAPLFVVYQVICFIDFGYTLNESLLAKDDNNDPFFCCANDGDPGAKKWTAFMLFLTIALFSSAMTGIVLLYHFYPTECAFNNAATTTTLVFSVLNLGITISPLAEHGSVLVGSLIFLYSTYLAFATVSAYPEEQCNPFVQDSGDDKAWLILSCTMASAAVAWMAYKMGKKMGGNMMTGKEVDGKSVETDGIVVVDSGQPSPEAHVAEAAAEQVPEASYLNYHFIMCLASLYVAMLVTDWGATSEVTSTQRHNVGYASAWLLMSANWVCQLLYLWTLIARRMCPDRDFD